MNKDKLGQYPAFNQFTFLGPGGAVETGGMYFGEDSCGMTARLFIATTILNGFLSSKRNDQINPLIAKEVLVHESLIFADELLKQDKK